MIDLPTANQRARRQDYAIVRPAPVGSKQWAVDSPDEALANLCMLFSRMPGARQYEFFQLKAGRATKQAFLLRWGRFEQSTKPQ